MPCTSILANNCIFIAVTLTFVKLSALLDRQGENLHKEVLGTSIHKNLDADLQINIIDTYLNINIAHKTCFIFHFLHPHVCCNQLQLQSIS